MDPKPTTNDHPLEDLANHHDTSFQKLFSVGTLGWITASLALFGLSWPLTDHGTVSNAILWSTSYWWIAFPFGLLCLIGYGMAKRSSFALAARAYLLPVAVIALLASICQLIYPDRSFRGDLLIFLPVVIVFYICGCIWMALAKDTGDQPTFARAVIPAIIGGIVTLSFVAVPVFRSNEFLYRNTFDFTIDKVTLMDQSIEAEGKLQIHEPGNFDFVEPRYFSIAMESSDTIDPADEVGTITWGTAGAPKADEKGTFPIKITWNRKLLPMSNSDYPVMDDSICLEVRDQEAKSDSIYSLIAEVPRK